MTLSLQTKLPFHQSFEFYCHFGTNWLNAHLLLYIIFCSRYNNGIKTEENSPDLSEHYILTYNVEICLNIGMLEYWYEVAPNWMVGDIALPQYLITWCKTWSMGTKYSLIMDNTQICLTIDRGDISPLLSLTTPQFSRIFIFDIIFQWSFSTTLVQLKPLYIIYDLQRWINPKFPNIFQHSWLRGGNTLTTIVKLLGSCQS